MEIHEQRTSSERLATLNERICKETERIRKWKLHTEMDLKRKVVSVLVLILLPCLFMFSNFSFVFLVRTTERVWHDHRIFKEICAGTTGNQALDYCLHCLSVVINVLFPYLSLFPFQIQNETLSMSLQEEMENRGEIMQK